MQNRSQNIAKLLLLTAALALSACGRSQESISKSMAQAQAKRQALRNPQVPERTDEEVTEETAILENLPDREMTREEADEYFKKVRESVREIQPLKPTPEKEEPVSAPSARPPVAEKPIPPKPVAPAKNTSPTPIIPAPPTRTTTPAVSTGVQPPKQAPIAAKPAPSKPSVVKDPHEPVLRPTPARPAVKPSPKPSAPPWAPWNWVNIPGARKTLPTATPSVKPAPSAKPNPPKKPTSQWPTQKPTETPKPIDDDEDTGIDPQEESASNAYTGPKTAIYYPRTTSEFRLSEIAANLATMSKSEYAKMQRDNVRTAYPACNYFLATALLEAGAVKSDKIPLYRAAEFDTYFTQKGWKKISLADLKKKFRAGQSFDVAIQKDPPKGKRSGHVAIPFGLNSAGNVIVAEGVLNRATNRVRVYQDSDIGKYNIFVRQ